jgi:hypothetical protein
MKGPVQRVVAKGRLQSWWVRKGAGHNGQFNTGMELDWLDFRVRASKLLFLHIGIYK